MNKMTPAMRREWEKLDKAYDYQSNDKRISLKQFKEIWEAAREALDFARQAAPEVQG